MIAAPFLGEFGWEVSVWVPWLRARETPTTVLCRRGHEALYRDFAGEIFVVPAKKLPQTTHTDCNIAWVRGVRLRAERYHALVGSFMGKKIPKTQIFTPMDVSVSWVGDEPPVARKCKWQRYGSEHRRELIVAHVRKLKQHPERNAAESSFSRVVPDVVVGAKRGAARIAGAQDCRGLPLHDVIELFSKAKVVVGPSSGPLALAMLCGAPVVWWSPNVKDVKRFGESWNPFEVVTVRAADSWDATPTQVERAVDEAMSLSALMEPR